MLNKIECWKWRDDYIDCKNPDEIEFISNFDMSDPYIATTHRDFDIIVVSSLLDGERIEQYVIDNTLWREQCWNVQ